MIIDLADTKKEQVELRSYLVEAITARIQDVFGECGPYQDGRPAEKRYFDDELLISRLLGITITFDEGKPIQTILIPRHRMIVTRCILLRSPPKRLQPGRWRAHWRDSESFRGIESRELIPFRMRSGIT